MWGQGYNTIPVEKDVPYSTYRVIPERLPSAPGFVAVLVGQKHYADVRAEIEVAFQNGARLVWEIYEDSRLIDVHRAANRKYTQWLRETDTIDAGDMQPGYSMKVADLFEEVVVE